MTENIQKAFDVVGNTVEIASLVLIFIIFLCWSIFSFMKSYKSNSTLIKKCEISQIVNKNKKKSIDRDIRKINRKIRKAAREGKNYCVYSKTDLSSYTIEELKRNGYRVVHRNDGGEEIDFDIENDQ